MEAKGWRLTSAEDFLGLTREEAALVEMKLALADALQVTVVGHQWCQPHQARSFTACHDHYFGRQLYGVRIA